MIARDLEAVQRPNGQSRPLEDKAARRATDPLALTHLNFLEGSGKPGALDSADIEGEVSAS
jgi:hypothetical protein